MKTKIFIGLVLSILSCMSFAKVIPAPTPTPTPTPTPGVVCDNVTIAESDSTYDGANVLSAAAFSECSTSCDAKGSFKNKIPLVVTPSLKFFKNASRDTMTINPQCINNFLLPALQFLSLEAAENERFWSGLSYMVREDNAGRIYSLPCATNRNESSIFDNSTNTQDALTIRMRNTSGQGYHLDAETSNCGSSRKVLCACF